MHLYTSKPNPVKPIEGNSKPTYKAYYELLFAPEDSSREEDEKEESTDSASADQQQQQFLPNSVINSLAEELANDSASWKNLAKELGT